MKRTTDVPKLPLEVVLQAADLSDSQARFLVANYYWAQEMRKRADMQIRHLGDKDLPVLLNYTADSSAMIEAQVQKALEKYAASKPVGRWMLSIDGVGPVISAGCLAHLWVEHPDPTDPNFGKRGQKVNLIPTETVGHWWRFAGLDPTDRWNKAEKRPWNANLKQVCWHAGQCFKRISWKDTAFYGQIYQAQKAKVVARNEAGEYAERAKTFRTNSAEVKATLATGKLPASNLDAQACRYAVKIFLSHLHALWYFDHYGKPPAKPFAIAHLGHAHEIRVPNSHMFPGFDAVYYGVSAQQAAE